MFYFRARNKAKQAPFNILYSKYYYGCRYIKNIEKNSIRSLRNVIKGFFYYRQSKSYLDFSLFRSTILHDHLVYKELLFAVIWFYFCKLFVLQGSSSFIQCIWLLPFYNRCYDFICGGVESGDWSAFFFHLFYILFLVVCMLIILWSNQLPFRFFSWFFNKCFVISWCVDNKWFSQEFIISAPSCDFYLCVHLR